MPIVLSRQYDADNDLVTSVYISKFHVDSQIDVILKHHPIYKPETFKNWLLKVISLIDLTTLSGDDTQSNVYRLCEKAASPLSDNIIEKLKVETKITTAAVCVYPNRVPDVKRALDCMGVADTIKIAAVASGFPSGLYPLETRLREIEIAVEKGANEIDVVIDRSLALAGKWHDIFHELQQMKEACQGKTLKVILAIGELGTYANVYTASMVAMKAGADFIKTSTGKEAVNATLPIGLVMCRAIREYYRQTKRKVGLKPAGGIKTPQDAVNWLVLVHTELGPEWLTPELFRIGASSLLDGIVDHLAKYKDE